MTEYCFLLCVLTDVMAPPDGCFLFSQTANPTMITSPPTDFQLLSGPTSEYPNAQIAGIWKSSRPETYLQASSGEEYANFPAINFVSFVANGQLQLR